MERTGRGGGCMRQREHALRRCRHRPWTNAYAVVMRWLAERCRTASATRCGQRLRTCAYTSSDTASPTAPQASADARIISTPSRTISANPKRNGPHRGGAGKGQQLQRRHQRRQAHTRNGRHAHPGPAGQRLQPAIEPLVQPPRHGPHGLDHPHQMARRQRAMRHPARHPQPAAAPQHLRRKQRHDGGQHRGHAGHAAHRRQLDQRGNDEKRPIAARADRVDQVAHGHAVVLARKGLEAVEQISNGFGAGGEGGSNNSRHGTGVEQANNKTKGRASRTGTARAYPDCRVRRRPRGGRQREPAWGWR